MTWMNPQKRIELCETLRIQSLSLIWRLTLNLHPVWLIVVNFLCTCPIFVPTVFLAPLWHDGSFQEELSSIRWIEHNLWASFGERRHETPSVILAALLEARTTNFSTSFCVERFNRSTDRELLAWIWSSWSASMQNTSSRLTIFVVVVLLL